MQIAFPRTHEPVNLTYDYGIIRASRDLLFQLYLDQMTHLFVASPCYGGLVHVQFMTSVMKLKEICERKHVKFTFFSVPFDSLIPRARNACVHAFMKSTADTFMFIDADIKFNPEDVIKMLESQRDVICGAYPKKCLKFDKLSLYATSSKTLPELVSRSVSYAVGFNATPTQSVAQARDIATGFLMIQRSVFEKLQKKSSVYVNDIHAYGHGETMCDYFPCGVFDGRYLSEDYGFARLCKNNHIPCFVDLTIKLDHIGSFTYHGDASQLISKAS